MELFKCEEALFPEYLPPTLPHREQQIKQVANNLAPLAELRKGQHTFIFGPPGIGKTAVIKYVFREFESYASVKTVYLNCWNYSTEYAVLAQLATELSCFVQRRGWAKDEILNRIVEAMKKLKQGVAVCLDEVDRLLPKHEAVLYELLRIDQYTGNPLALVLISNQPAVLLGLEPRIRSSLSIELIEFKPYTLSEMHHILEERIRLALKPGCLEEGVVLLAANHAVRKGGDVRVGLECLLRAARLAESEGSPKLLVKHMRNVLAGVGKIKPQILASRLDQASKQILEILKHSDGITPAQLYEIYCSTHEGIALSTFRSRLLELKRLGLVSIRRSQKLKKRLVYRVLKSY